MHLFAPMALLPSGWASNVGLEIGEDGAFSAVVPGSSPQGASRLRGSVVPGMPNLHAHAFQRALAGCAEQRGRGEDSFWSWREAMYELADSLDPERFQAIVTHAYVEMLEVGYTAVGEFHYLHNAPNGIPYAHRTEMAQRVLAAARAAGIGLTLLPVWYRHGGVGGSAPERHQRRFVMELDAYLDLWRDLAACVAGDANLRLGAAPHSLRAVTGEELTTLCREIETLDPRAPLHMHVAEQEAEVMMCRRVLGASPVAYLYDRLPVDERWCLVHATHATEDELAQIAASGAVVGLCPTTEANLGDGIFPAAAFAARGGRFGIGSDGNVSIDVAEELRWLEYGQRLRQRRRALLASEGIPSVGEFTYRAALRGGAQALGRPIGAIAPGMRADLVVLDEETTLDAYVFVRGRAAVRDVMVGGRWVVRDGRHVGR